MPKIARRFRVVPIPQAEQEAALDALRVEVTAAQGLEDATGTRFGGKSDAAAKALAWDKLKAKAEKDALQVKVWALAYDEFGPLQDAHPPREGDELDKRLGYNRSTFLHALLKCSLVEPEAVAGDTPEDLLANLIALGDEAWAELGRPSHGQYARLEKAAWEVNVGDDSLPKFSAVSLLREARENASKPPSELE